MQQQPPPPLPPCRSRPLPLAQFSLPSQSPRSCLPPRRDGTFRAPPRRPPRRSPHAHGTAGARGKDATATRGQNGEICALPASSLNGERKGTGPTVSSSTGQRLVAKQWYETGTSRAAGRAAKPCETRGGSRDGGRREGEGKGAAASGRDLRSAEGHEDPEAHPGQGRRPGARAGARRLAAASSSAAAAAAARGETPAAAATCYCRPVAVHLHRTRRREGGIHCER